MAAKVSLKEIIEHELAAEEISLPIMDNMASNLHSMLMDENVSIQKLAEVIEKDPSLTIKVLNLSNSSFYAGLAKVRNVDRAISRIGLKTIKNFLMTVSLKGAFHSKGKRFHDLFQMNWEHSLGCALCGKRIAEQINLKSIAEDAYLLGLLHDIGTVSILNTLNKYYENMKQAMDVNDNIVNEILNAFQARAGAMILEKMHFDERFCKIVSMQDRPEEYNDPDDPLFNILKVSNHVLDKAGISLNPDPTIALMGLPYTRKLRLEAMFFAVIEVDLEDSLENMKDMI
ncbi:MAG: HDOD domain-containing protein [Thermodesulfobacteriota bacterium]|nr:HDOD domain-containing protein [Thermodesulfobacteriota bacterium]